MPEMSDWWARQFTEGAKEIARLYACFEASCDLAVFDLAKDYCNSLNRAYTLSFDFFDYLELGRSLLAERDLPQK